MRYTAVLSLAATALLLTGCKPDAAVRTGAPLNGKPAKTTTGTPVDPATAGAVSGTVLLSGKAPERIQIDMSQDPACSVMASNTLTDQIVATDGKLANVYVYVKQGPNAAMNAAPAAPSLTHTTLDQKGCRYAPHVIAIMHGGSVSFVNSDPTMHNVHTMPTVSGNEVIDVSMGPHGQTQTRTFDSPETMMPIRCNNHPWMSAFLNVAPTPFFAVTSSNGTFTIPGLPPGDYTLTAVQEKLGSQDLHITVAPHATSTANFTYKAEK